MPQGWSKACSRCHQVLLWSQLIITHYHPARYHPLSPNSLSPISPNSLSPISPNSLSTPVDLAGLTSSYRPFGTTAAICGSGCFQLHLAPPVPRAVLCFIAFYFFLSFFSCSNCDRTGATVSALMTRSARCTSFKGSGFPIMLASLRSLVQAQAKHTHHFACYHEVRIMSKLQMHLLILTHGHRSNTGSPGAR